MTDGEAIPTPSRLPWIAKANVILGIASLVRFGPELLSVLHRDPKLAYYALVALDLLIAGLWLKCGLALKKHGRGALGFATLGGAVIFSHSIMSAIFVGHELVPVLSRMSSSDSAYFFMLSIAGSRFLIYAIEFLFWPYALMVLLRVAGESEEDPGARRSVRRAMIAAFLLGGLFHCVYFAGVFGR